MRNKKLILFLSITLFVFSFSSSAQTIGVGADVIYNFQTNGFGAGARVNIFPNNRLSFVPQFSYFPSFNIVNEYFIGMSLEYKVIRRDKFNIYAIAHGAYNSWVSYKTSPMKNAKQDNWNAELGIGISNNRCIRPFFEYRYNFKFYEGHIRLGILYIFGCRKGNSNDRCAAYGAL